MAESDEQSGVSLSVSQNVQMPAEEQQLDFTLAEEASPEREPVPAEEETYKHELRFVVMNTACGSIIGKGGEMIKATNEKFNVHVSIPVTNTDIRTLVITGKRTPILNALTDLIPKFKNAPVHAFERKEHNINLLIPDGLAPILIGSGGGRVGNIRKETKCSIKVFDHNLPYSNERLVIIAGTVEGLIAVMGIILDLYEKSRFERNVRRINCSRLFKVDLEQGLTLEGIPPGTRYAREMRFPRNGPPHYQHPYAHPPPPPHYPPRPLMREPDVEPVTTQVSIPLDHAKFVIGPKGASVRRIEAQSMCKIHLEEPKPDCSIRIISITGTPRQINEAEYLLQQTIMDCQRRRKN